MIHRCRREKYLHPRCAEFINAFVQAAEGATGIMAAGAMAASNVVRAFICAAMLVVD